jgi:predicted metal-dependent hydrolase
VQLNLFAGWSRPRPREMDSVVIGTTRVPLQMVRNARARRYVLRVSRDGAVRVTIPRGGSTAFALAFAQKNAAWIAQQLQRRSAEPPHTAVWKDGTEILLHGEAVRLRTELTGELALVHFGQHVLAVPASTTDLRPAVENYLWRLAEKELLPRLDQLAALHQVSYDRAVIRNQRSRWGSCSPRKTISLNWRLIQAPPHVRDYMLLHELMHLREMNHSHRFWSDVESVCPDYAKAESWLNQHAHLLR